MLYVSTSLTLGLEKTYPRHVPTPVPVLLMICPVMVQAGPREIFVQVPSIRAFALIEIPDPGS